MEGTQVVRLGSRCLYQLNHLIICSIFLSKPHLESTHHPLLHPINALCRNTGLERGVLVGNGWEASESCLEQTL